MKPKYGYVWTLYKSNNAVAKCYILPCGDFPYFTVKTVQHPNSRVGWRLGPAINTITVSRSHFADELRRIRKHKVGRIIRRKITNQ